MPPTVDQDDTQTQVLDLDSPHSGCGYGFMAGETLPRDCGETQRVDVCDDNQLDEDVQDWGKTQAIDEYEETEVVRYDHENDGGGQSERTELVTDDEGIVEDFGDEVVSVVKTKDANLVDPDASTDEEEGCGDYVPECSRKSFVAIRVAAFRSSGIAAAGKAAHIPKGVKSKPSNPSEGNCHAHNLEKVEDSHIGKKGKSMETMPCSVSCLNITSTMKDKVVSDIDADDNRYNYLYHEDETKKRSESNKEKLAYLRCEQTGAGLNYISSQEPGAHSQAIALGVVDKFLSLNCEGSSQDMNNKNLDTVISPPIASVKKAQHLAKKSDKSTVGNIQVYDWIDSLEDEGGGELFSRRKNTFFDLKENTQISCSRPSEIKLGGSKMIGGAIDNSSNVKAKLVSSLSKSKENRSNKMKEQANTETVEKLEESSLHTDDLDAYNVGPSTQMAVEAMQALVNSTVNFELANLQPKHGENIKASTKTRKSNRTCSNSPTSARGNNSDRSEGIVTRSKLQSNTKSGTKRCNSLKKQSTELRKKIDLEDITAEVTAKLMSIKSDKEYKEVVPLNNGEYDASLVNKTMKTITDENAKDPPVPLCKQPSDDGICIAGFNEMYTSPIAHRTRHSKVAKHLSVNRAFSNGSCENMHTKNVQAHKALSEMAGDHVGETGASYDNDSTRESKRRKMNNNCSENHVNDIKLNNHCKSYDVIAPKPSVQKKPRKVFIKSVAEILDTVKRKKRSVSANSKFDFNSMPSDVGKMRNVGKMPSLLSNILKPYFANDLNCKDQLFCNSASVNTSSCMKQLVQHDCLETSKKGVQYRLLTEFATENSKHDGYPNAISQSDLPCSSTACINAISPICNSKYNSRISLRKSLSRSPVSRELIRLEASYTSPSKLNDMRRRKDMASFLVCFSSHLCQDVIKQQKKILKRLEIRSVSSSLEATHLVADKFVRTRNMLEAMAMGKLVVTPMWLECCGQASSYIDEKNYILRDAKKEKEIGFSMPVSLFHACQHPLLQGKQVFVTRNARPDQGLISSLVKAAGGQPLKRSEVSIAGAGLPENLLILSGEEDFAVCAPLLEKGATAFNSELLLNGIVVQKLEYDRHQLFLNQAGARLNCK